MRLLVTRPEPDALLLKARLEKLGHDASVAPLLTSSFEGCDPIDLSEVQALIATSRNGLRALKAQNAHKIAALLPLYAVGAATAKDAKALGFTEITTGGGTVASLIPAIVATADPQADVLLHLAGDEVGNQLASELELHGFRLLQPVVYRMIPAASFDPDIVDQIETGEIDGVLLFSPRTASIYAQLVSQHKLTAAVRRMTHFCLSEAVAARLTPLAPLRIEIAEATSLDAMLALVT